MLVEELDDFDFEPESLVEYDFEEELLELLLVEELDVLLDAPQPVMPNKGIVTKIAIARNATTFLMIPP